MNCTPSVMSFGCLSTGVYVYGGTIEGLSSRYVLHSIALHPGLLAFRMHS